MKIRLFYIAVFTCLFGANTFGQLSPGDLASSHAHLEGISNCTQCHALGQKVSNAKCLDCHSEIKVRLDRQAGFHASKDVRAQDCATCHSDHHGRKFDMVRFNEDSFDHNLTGYKLTGAHEKIDCRDCHTSERILDEELKDRIETFLGLGTECINCHEDYHQNTLDNDCTKCHSTDAFSPASLFDHANTQFALLGKHQDVECIECHQMETRNGEEFQRFADVPFTNCNSCHDDAHNNNLGTDCKQCHIEESFSSHRRLNRFNHTKTGFTLKGQHRNIDCYSCHAPQSRPIDIFQDNLGIAADNCVACHEDIHKGKFGVSCIDCHTEESFRVAGSLDNFDHGLTNFALEGKHETVDCRQCHISESFTDPLPHNTCAECHSDYHEGAFVDGASRPDCVECHKVDGFSPSLYTIEAHAKSDFPLDGAHVATPCFACHLRDGDKWQFKNIGLNCVDCHEDIHVNEITASFYPNQNCRICHNTSLWKGNKGFDHGLTAFALEGGHLEVDCASCHVTETEPFRQFKGVSHECSSCHENVHGTQFETDGSTDCRRCHGFDNWEASRFDHSQTHFPLEGKHAEVECSQCHQAKEEEGDILVIYKMDSFECIDCHN
ncbi:MAG: cytochrome c family protein [Bacteroidota bacterium]